MEKNSEETLCFLYRLDFSKGKPIEFPIVIDKQTCTLLPERDMIAPSWAALEFQQCVNCPLHKETHPYCPIAANLVPLLALCSDVASFQSVRLEVLTAERTISGETTMQRALSSMLGLIMATSACPHTEYLKPMARFHLPLASQDETVYRTTSMYLLAQFFRRKDGLDFSMELDQLKAIYQNLQIINRAMAKRLREAVTDDATVNAVILLDMLSQVVNWSIEDGLEEIRYLFKSYGVKSALPINSDS
jgi:hypothetical protein